MVQKSLLLICILVIHVLFVSCKSTTLIEKTKASISQSGLEERIKSFNPNPKYRDDKAGLVTLQEALAAVKEGNHGVGACLVREKTGEIVQRGHNRILQPYFRSDLHAEMDTLNGYEDRVKASSPQMEGLVLYTSLESCPMCVVRLITAGVRKVYSVSPDPDRSMVHLFKNLPPAWQKIAEGMVFEPAQCSPELRDLANEIFQYSLKASPGKTEK